MKKLICLVLAVMLVLSAVSAFAAEYTDKETVKKVQQALNDAGFNCGTPDGAAGKKTKAAITDYQNANGLTATGVIDDELLVSLGLAEAEAAETTEEAPVEAEADETAATDEGYTFQGIPWGSTPEEVEAILVENGLIDEGDFHINDTGSVYYPNDNDKDEMFHYLTQNTIDGIGGVYEEDTFKKQIGGHQPILVVFYFIYDVENGDITPDLALTMVSILYEYDTELFGEMTEKLKTSYGDCSEIELSPSIPLRSWKNGNTIISLLDVIGHDYLTYAKTDDYIIGQQIQEIIAANAAPVEEAGL